MLKSEIENTINVLRAGGIILYPTDTVWGLGCDATNSAAVAKINAIKGRPANKSLIVLLDSDVKLAGYVSDIPDVAYDLIEFAENPLTIVYSGAKNLADNIVNSDDTVAIRIVRHEFCRQLIQRFRKPIVSTSANLAGEPTPAFFDEIDVKIKEQVDYIVGLEQDLRIAKKPSTIIKLGAGGQFSFIRK